MTPAISPLTPIKIEKVSPNFVPLIFQMSKDFAQIENIIRASKEIKAETLLDDKEYSTIYDENSQRKHKKKLPQKKDKVQLASTFFPFKVKRNFRSDIISCSCDKSKCKKLYCQCFKENRHCGQACGCRRCQNRDPAEIRNRKITSKIKGKRLKKEKESITCTCKKVKCKKNYCECFQQGTACTIDCACIGCLNRVSNLECNETLDLSSFETTLKRIENKKLDEEMKSQESILRGKKCLQKMNSFATVSA